MDAYTAHRAIQVHYTKHDIPLEVDKKTVLRLMSSLQEELEMIICDCSTLCPGCNIRMNVLYNPSIPDIETKMKIYMDNFMHWYRTGRHGVFRNTSAPLVGDGVEAVLGTHTEVCTDDI